MPPGTPVSFRWSRDWNSKKVHPRNGWTAPQPLSPTRVSSPCDQQSHDSYRQRAVRFCPAQPGPCWLGRDAGRAAWRKATDRLVCFTSNPTIRWQHQGTVDGYTTNRLWLVWNPTRKQWRIVTGVLKFLIVFFMIPLNVKIVPMCLA